MNQWQKVEYVGGPRDGESTVHARRLSDVVSVLDVANKEHEYKFKERRGDVDLYEYQGPKGAQV